MSGHIFFEGGGQTNDLKTACRKGLRLFLEKAGVKGRMPRITACGGRQEAYSDFKRAHAQGAHDGPVLLLVDAEGPVATNNPWQHLSSRDQWARPAGATDEQCHLMVQFMKSWLLTDTLALQEFFGQGFRENALPRSPQIELISKDDVIAGLEGASQPTSKGAYAKGRHSFEILARLDPSKVSAASPWAKRFLETLRSMAGQDG